jgi:hypothetical protein
MPYRAIYSWAAIPQTRLPLAVLAELDISASVIASAPLPHVRWDDR